MDYHPILYVMVPYSIQSPAIKNIESTLDQFYERNKLDKEAYANVNHLFKNILNINNKYTNYLFQYYKLFSSKTISDIVFSKSYMELKSIFKDIYISKNKLLNLPITFKLSEVEYNTLTKYIDNYNNSITIPISVLLKLSFLDNATIEQLFYEILIYSYFSFQTLPNENGLYLYGFKLSKHKQTMLFNVFTFEPEKKKDIQKYFSIINTLYEDIQDIYIKDIQQKWISPPDSIFDTLKENFYNPMNASIQNKLQINPVSELYYKENYSIEYDSPIVYKVSAKHDPIKASPTIFYKFVQILNIISLEINPYIRKTLINTLVYNNYSDGLVLQEFLNNLKEPTVYENKMYTPLYTSQFYNKIQSAKSVGLFRLEWINGSYKYTPFPLDFNTTVQEYLKSIFLFKDPVASLYGPHVISESDSPLKKTSQQLFLPISYTPTIQIIYSIIFHNMIIPSIVNDINKNN